MAQDIGQQIVSEYLDPRRGCRWASYTTDEIQAAFGYACRMDLNKLVRMLARVLDARGALDERDKYLAR